MQGIKSIRPSKNSRFKQTYINPESCHKLFESLRHQPIICRSSWETKFIHWCENCPNVKAWGSECISWQYTSYLDGKVHTYYPDFVVEMKNGEKWVVEIKPYQQTQKPDPNNQWLTREYIKNVSKWTSIKERCDRLGYKFYVLTEKTIGKLP